ncbi:MAG: hypothetical protein AAF401_11375 [Pseudomonadota bacterium]
MLSAAIANDLNYVQGSLGQEFVFERPAGAPTEANGDGAAPKPLTDAAKSAIRAFKASPEGAAFMNDLPTLNLFELGSRLKAALEGPHFADMLALSRNPAEFDIDLGDFIPKAVSIGLTGEAVLLIGVTGAVFYAMDISTSDPKPAAVVGGGLDIGADGGAQGDIAVGFWRDQTSDITGWYVGEEIDIDDGGGGYEATFEKDKELALVLIGVGVGFEDGAENSDLYFYSFDFSHSPIYQSGDYDHMIQFHNVTCDNSKDNMDTVFFYYLADDDPTEYRYPAWAGYQMAEADKGDFGNGWTNSDGDEITFNNWGTGEIVKFNSKITIKLNVGDYEMDAQTFTTGDFSGVGSSASKNFHAWTDAHINEINYNISGTLLK